MDTDLTHDWANGDFLASQIVEAFGLALGLTALITQVMPGKDRALVLMDFLGRQSTVEIPVTSIVKHITR